MNPKNTNWFVVAVFIVLGLLAIGGVGLIGKTLEAIPEGRFIPEIALTILLLAGIVAFIAVMAIAVAVFAALGLADRAHAFGMPEGTVRAVIALNLIIIFAMTSVYLYGRLRTPPTAKLTGLTQEQLADIPGDQIIFSEPSKSGANLFDVERQLERNETSEDFAQQMLTTISTLVVAVAGFYFGTKAVAVAKEALEQASLRILQPSSPATLGKDMTKMTIRLETKPVGLAIEGRVNGYIDESLKQIRHDEFEYSRPAEAPAGPVALAFALVARPDVTQTLMVTVEPSE